MKCLKQGMIICCVLIACQSSMVFGNERRKLTVLEATTHAFAHSSDLKKSQEDYIVNDDNMSNLKDRMFEATDETTVLNLAVQIMQNEIKSASYSADEQTKRDLIENSITQFFCNIIAAEKDLELYEQNIAIGLKEYNIEKIKFGLGLISEADLIKAKNVYEKMLFNRQTKETAIANAYKSLNDMMGANSNDQYEVTLSLQYKPLGDVHINSVILNAIDQNVEVKSLKSAVDVASYQLSAYSSANTSSSKETVQISVTQAARNLSDKKTSIENKVIAAYNEIKDLETEYEANVLELASLKKQVTIKEAQLQLGKATQLELDKAKFQVAQLNETIRKQAYNHEVKVSLFKSPWLL